ncbi:MAG: GAF domain-containing protein [Chloroflexi bacterium]|nr:GAF domain-containing protein [Chloroflexota bacterium]
MGKPLRVLNVEDSEDDALLLRRHLARAGYDLTIERVDTANALTAALDRQEWDIVIADYVMPHFSAPAALALVQERGIDLPFIILSGAIGEETAVAAMRAGAHDFLVKQNLTRLVPAIERELREAAVRRERRRAEEALRASEARLRLLMEQVPAMVWTTDTDLRVTATWGTGLAGLHLRSNQTAGMTLAEYFQTDAPDLVPIAAHRQALRGERAVFEMTWQGHAYQSHVEPLYSAAGRLLGRIGVALDITERKRAEEAQRFLAEAGSVLAASLDYETTLQNVARLAVPFLADWCLADVVEEDGAIRRVAAVHADPAKQELTEELRRFPPDMCKAEGVPSVLRTGQAVLVSEVSDAQMEAAAQSAEHLRIWRALGSRSSMVVPLRARGRVLGALAFVSARPGRYGPADLALAEELARRAALAVDNARLYRTAEAQRRRLETVLEQIPEGVLIGEAPDGRFVLWNSAAQGFWDRPIAGDSMKQRFYRVRPSYAGGQPYAFEELPLMRALRGETVLGMELAWSNPDQTRTIVLINAAPIYDEQDRIIAAVTVFQDITQRKTMEQMKDDFLSLAAHELKTPLTAIKGHSQLLLRQLARGQTVLDEVEARILRTIAERADYMAGLVSELLDLSRIETDRLALHPEPVDLAQLLREVVAQQQGLHADHPFLLEGADQPVWGVWDRGRLEQVLTNLLDNAAKYSPPGRPVTARLRASQGQAHVAVQDQGIGIPARDLPHLFERHFRASNVGMAPSGLGVGLYLSSQMVRRHGGRLWAESVEGEGSTFHVELPLDGAPPQR